MRTLAQSYAEKNHCPETDCERRLFLACLHRRAFFAFPSVVAMFNPLFFSADHELIRAAAHATDLAQLERAITDFQSDSRNYEWWRRRMRLRVSVSRLRRLARQHLPRSGDGSRPPAGSIPPMAPRD
ncbi:MAG: hypothetical protein JSS11_06770 [Verrucomicrobia bacterium]|nr:hypothetical protein [Verrucomicrobiota bacterium]